LLYDYHQLYLEPVGFHHDHHPNQQLYMGRVVWQGKQQRVEGSQPLKQTSTHERRKKRMMIRT